MEYEQYLVVNNLIAININENRSFFVFKEQEPSENNFFWAILLEYKHESNEKTVKRIMCTVDSSGNLYEIYPEPYDELNKEIETKRYLGKIKKRELIGFLTIVIFLLIILIQIILLIKLILLR